MPGERLPFLTRACVACKEKKLRCLMSDGPPWNCKRCLQKKLKCVIPESRPRHRRKKAVHELRIEQLERNIDHVISLLPNSEQSSILLNPARPEAPQGLGSSEQSIADGIHQVISAQQAEQLVADYREHFAKSFPYTILPVDANFMSMLRTSPMLLLAILVTTSWKDKNQLDSLNRHFLKTLSTKLIMHCDRDLDLLNGLLVYLNWIHLHMAPRKQQAYRLMSIAASMAVDYGITRRPGKGRHQQLNLESASEVPQGLTVLDKDFWSLEARRSYLGCYHIATWYSIITRKMSPLAYNDYLQMCAQSLSVAKDVSSDSDLIFHLEITREAEKVYTLFNYTEVHQTQFMNDEQIQIYLNAFSVKLQDWRARLPLSLAEDPSQKVWPSLFEAFLREVSLSGMSRSTDMSIFRIRVVIDSLKSTKEFFDTFLAIPSAHLPSLSSTHWALLGYSILLTATMSLSIHTPGWNIEMARSIIKLDIYIDAMSVHVRDLSSIMSPLGSVKDWYGSLLTRWNVIKSSYLAALQQAQSGTTLLPTAAAEQQLVPFQIAHQEELPASQIPTTAEPQPETRASPMADNFFNPNGGLEIFNFPADLGSWMVPDFEFSWYGIAGF